MRRFISIVLFVMLSVFLPMTSHAQPCNSVPSPGNSSLPSSISVDPNGNVCYEFTIRDLANNPVCGANVVLDFSEADITFCGVQPAGTIVNEVAKTARGVTDNFGFLRICVCACLKQSSTVRILSDGVTLAVLPTNPVGPACMVECLDPPQACAAVPSHNGVWFPFSECATSQTKELAYKGNAQLLNGATWIQGHTGCGMSFPNDHSVVQTAPSPGSNPNTNSFSVSAWIKSGPSGPGFQRHIMTKGFSQSGGYYLRSNVDDDIEFSMWAPGQLLYLTGTSLEDNQWHYVVATVDRWNAPYTARLYVDGVMVDMQDTNVPTGSVESNTPLYIGNIDGSNFPCNFNGVIDDVQVFMASLTQEEISAVYAAGTTGQCTEYVYVARFTRCRGTDPAARIRYAVGNFTQVNHNYEAGPKQLPAGPGCSVAGPIVFTPLYKSYSVSNGDQREDGWDLEIPFIPPGGSACYKMSVRNQETGHCMTGLGKIICPGTPWWAPHGPMTGMLVNTNYQFNWYLHNLTANWHITKYKLTVTTAGGQVALGNTQINGLPSGQPFVSPPVSVAPQDSTPVQFVFRVNTFDPFTTYTILLETDTDGDGNFQPVALLPFISSLDGSPPVSVDDPVIPTQLALSAAPNPTTGRTQIRFSLPAAGPASLELYDVLGRKVQTWNWATQSAGTHSVDWNGVAHDGRIIPPSVLYYRLRFGSMSIKQKLVHIR